jgi:eukaryotic-like serine/threonine-protein kinase
VIVFSSGHLGLYQIPGAGGTAVKVPIAEKDRAAYRWPSFLPDGKHVLVTEALGGVFAVTLATGQVQSVLPGENSPAQYVEPGYLLFLRGGILLAQPFDAATLRTTGSAQTLAESVSSGQSFSVSDTGLLLYQTALQAQLTWVDPDGKKISTVGDPGTCRRLICRRTGAMRWSPCSPRTKKSEALAVRPQPGNGHSIHLWRG